MPNPFDPDGPHEPNRYLHDAVLRAKIKVNSDYNPKIFHQKFIIRDGESVLTGSTNFTETGTSKNLNNIVIIHDKEIAKIFNVSQGFISKIKLKKRNFTWEMSKYMENHFPIKDKFEWRSAPFEEWVETLKRADQSCRAGQSLKGVLK